MPTYLRREIVGLRSQGRVIQKCGQAAATAAVAAQRSRLVEFASLILLWTRPRGLQKRDRERATHEGRNEPAQV